MPTNDLLEWPTEADSLQISEDYKHYFEFTLIVYSETSEVITSALSNNIHGCL